MYSYKVICKKKKKSIFFIPGTLKVTSNMGQSRSGNNSNEGVIYTF